MRKSWILLRIITLKLHDLRFNYIVSYHYYMVVLYLPQAGVVMYKPQLQSLEVSENGIYHVFTITYVACHSSCF